MTVHALTGRPAADVDALRTAYFAQVPDIADRAQRVRFGTSGHRGAPLRAGFNEAHVLAIAQAICDYRVRERITGPLFIGRDPHALSELAFTTAVEVLAANRVTVMLDPDGTTPAPTVSRAIVKHNRAGIACVADGIVVTPAHGHPGNGGIKYLPPTGGPAEIRVTRWIDERANRLLAAKPRPTACRITYSRARHASTTHVYDYVGAYVRDLSSVVDMDAIRGCGLCIGVEPIGGDGAQLWAAIGERYGLNVEVVPGGVTSLVLSALFDLAFRGDTERSAVVTRGAGLMHPNHYLAAAARYLFTHRTGWPASAAVGKTVMSSSLFDRVARSVGRPLVEVPVGFGWFVSGLLDATLGFGGEEGAGAACLQRDGTTWTSDRDGIVMDLIAAEMMACTGRDPAESYAALARELGEPRCDRIDVPATPQQKALLASISPADVFVPARLGGDLVEQVLTVAPGNGMAINGLKVVTANGWFAARPSRTEPIYRLYAESFRDSHHLQRIQTEAQAMLGRAFAEVAPQ